MFSSGFPPKPTHKFLKISCVLYTQPISLSFNSCWQKYVKKRNSYGALQHEIYFNLPLLASPYIYMKFPQQLSQTLLMCVPTLVGGLNFRKKWLLRKHSVSVRSGIRQLSL